jgi:hypothetical protein
MKSIVVIKSIVVKESLREIALTLHFLNGQKDIDETTMGAKAATRHWRNDPQF